MLFVVIQGGQVVETPELGVEVIDLDELERNPESYHGYSDQAQQYIQENYGDMVPEDTTKENET